VIAAPDGRIVRVNAQAEKRFGSSCGELLGREVEMLIPERFRKRHVEQRGAYPANPTAQTMGAGLGSGPGA
jgi:rsbT co-antagonist protein RsbR